MAIALAVALILYLPLRSIQWDLNGIIEAQAVDLGGAGLLAPNHMLYRPLGRIVLALARSLGYGGHSAALLQYLTALMAAVCVALYWLWIRMLTGNLVVATIATAFLATSRSFWRFSADVHYIVPAATLVVAALVVISRAERPTRAVTGGLGVLTAAAVLFWQANVVLVPIIALGIALKPGAMSRREMLSRLAVFLVVVGVLVSGAYLVVGTFVNRISDLRHLAAWASSHSTGQTVPLWGQWSFDRLSMASIAGLRSFVPVNANLDGSALDLRAVWSSPLVFLSIFAFLLLCALTIFGMTINRAGASSARVDLAWLALAYGAYVAFVIWWDPRDLKWYIIPNLFLIGGFARAWGVTLRHPKSYLTVAALVAVIACANFAHAIWPRYARPNPRLELARCFADNATDEDTVILTDWSWFPYADYFFGYRGSHLTLIGHSGDGATTLQRILEEMANARKRGGRAYMRALDEYSPEERAYFQGLVPLEFEDLDGLAWEPAFSCPGGAFVRRVERRP